MSSMTLAMLLTLKDLASGPLAQFQGNLEKTSQHLMASGAAAKAAGEKIMSAMKLPIDTFSAAEDASIRLETTMMRMGGVVDSSFGKVNELAVSLGNKLPGNTADFQNMFSVLLQNKITPETILGGLGEATANLAVLLNQDFSSMAASMAQISKAAGVQAKDMLPFADTLQKIAHQGVSVTDMGYAFSKSAGALKTFGIQGNAAASAFAPVMTMLFQLGHSGETIGTNMNAMMNNLFNFERGATKQAKEAKQSLKAMGIEIDIFDNKTGNLRGPREMIKELEKLKPLSKDKQSAILTSIFGSGTDADFAKALINGGIKEYDALVADMEKQAKLDERIKRVLTSLKNVFDAAIGTFENTMAAFIEPIAPELKKMSDRFGELAEKASEFMKAHPELTKFAAGFALAGGSALIAGGTAVMGAGMFLNAANDAAKGYKVVRDKGKDAIRAMGDFSSVIPQANNVIKTKVSAMGSAVKTNAQWVRANLLSVQGLKDLAKAGFAKIKTGFGNMTTAIKTNVGIMKAWVSTNLMTKSGLKSLALAPFKAIGGGFKAIGGAIRAAGMAALTNPLLWVAIAIAGAGLLIYKYWKPIKGFFSGLWQGLKSGLAPLAPAFNKAFKPWKPLIQPIIGMLKGVWNWIKNLLKPVDDVGGKSQNMGKRFGQAIAGMILKGAELVVKFSQKVAAFAEVGRQLVNGLKRGFGEAWAGLKQWVGTKAGELTGIVKSTFGINSPSRVFAGIGKGLGQGLQLGMESTTGTLNKAALKMAKAATPELPKLATIKASGSALPEIATTNASLGPGSPGFGSGGGMQITFAPNINLQPGSPAAQQVQEVMPLLYEEFKRMMRQYMHDENRSFA